MKLDFYKLSATGNDFIAVDNRTQRFMAGDKSLWKRLCTRRTGIGADGVLLLEEGREQAHFSMKYINADGSSASMCGNGGRAITFLAQLLKISPDSNGFYRFMTDHGAYRSRILTSGTVELLMSELYDLGRYDLASFPFGAKALYLNTGVPHAVFQVDDLDNIDLSSLGESIRYHRCFGPEGTNVDWFQILNDNSVSMRTYERGIEGETLSCGTGAMAVAIALQKLYNWSGPIKIRSRGGDLAVSFTAEGRFLSGGVDWIYSGQCEL